MMVDNIKIENYKCFYEKINISLKSGFNLFIGKNNSGKTTALELLNSFDYLSDAHRSILSIRNFGDSASKNPKHSISITLTIAELVRIFGKNIMIPLPKGILLRGNISNLENEIGKKIIADNKITIQYTFTTKTSLVNTITSYGESEDIEFNTMTANAGIEIDFSPNENEPTFSAANFGGVTKTLKNPTNLNRFIYRFSALRIPQAQFGMDHSRELRSDASNLAYCINHLQTNDAEGHKQLCLLVNRIFPEVQWIQSPPDIYSKQFELRCLPLSVDNRRDDLAIPLNKMGTGIGNVISILYVILTSRFPQVIAIDEPNSFLHPKALRELLQILEVHGKQHQYILTGHSPEVLTALEPSTLTYFEIKDSSAKIRQFTKNEYHELRSELSDLGIRMTDLHAKDRVLWVEGQTEEIVFPKLLREYCPEISAGTAVLRVTHTGTFESGKVHINEVANTYKRLTQTSLAPPMIAIVLDTEGRQPQDIEKITRENNSLLHFLPYKMIENYALDADAILAILKNYDVIVERSSIEAYLPSDDEGRKNADGAKILKDIFDNLSSATHEFRKTTHTPELFDWLLENKKDKLKPIELFVKSIGTSTP